MGKGRYTLGILGAALGLALGCRAAPAPVADLPPLRIRADVDRATANIYDPITYVVRVDYADGVAPELPEQAPAVAGLLIDDAREVGPELLEGRSALTRTYVLHAEQPGNYIVPPFTVAYTLPDGTKAEATTARLFLDIASVLGEGSHDLSALRPVKPPVPVPRDYTDAWLVGLGIVVGLLVAAALIAFWLRRRGRRTEAVAPPRPPHEVALNALAALERGTLLAEGRVREYVFALTEIFSAYLEGRFGIPAVASTSEQLVPLVRETPGLPPDTHALAQRFLTDADPIKFAQAPAAMHLAEAWTADVRRYVESTRPDVELEAAA